MYAVVNGELVRYPDELYHFGIKGMKWGVRRYQDESGSYTSAGRSRYGIGDGKSGYTGVHKGASSTSNVMTAKKKKKGLTDKQKAALKTAAVVAGGAAAAYGAYRIGKVVKRSTLLNPTVGATRNLAKVSAKEFRQNPTVGAMKNYIKTSKKLKSTTASAAVKSYSKSGKENVEKTIRSAAKNASFKDAYKNAPTVDKLKRASKQIDFDLGSSTNAARKVAEQTKNVSRANKQIDFNLSNSARTAAQRATQQKPVQSTVKRAATQAKPKLEFGGSAQAVSNQRLREQQETLRRAAQRSQAAANRAPEGRELAEELLKKNKRRIR